MRMYCAKTRARSPVLIFSPATDLLGNDTFLSPAAFASAAMALGVMSGVPTICSVPRLERTVSRPFTPMTVAPMPKAISTTAAAMPPQLKNFDLMTFLLTGCVGTRSVSIFRPYAPAVKRRTPVAGNPQLVVGERFDHVQPCGAASRQHGRYDACDDCCDRDRGDRAERQVERDTGDDRRHAGHPHEPDQEPCGQSGDRTSEREEQALVDHRLAHEPARGPEGAQDADLTGALQH